MGNIKGIYRGVLSGLVRALAGLWVIWGVYSPKLIAFLECRMICFKIGGAKGILGNAGIMRGCCQRCYIFFFEATVCSCSSRLGPPTASTDPWDYNRWFCMPTCEWDSFFCLHPCCCVNARQSSLV